MMSEFCVCFGFPNTDHIFQQINIVLYGIGFCTYILNQNASQPSGVRDANSEDRGYEKAVKYRLDDGSS